MTRVPPNAVAGERRPDHAATAQAFDAIAPSYDAAYGPEANEVMAWMRRESLAVLERTFPAGSRLLEIGCGTGEEAIALARGGRDVVATDISPAMARLALTKARASGQGDRVTAVALPARCLDALCPGADALFDGAYASFGSLNCEPELEPVMGALARLVRPGGAFVCSVMARCCPFEIAWYLAHARPQQAFRRFRGWQQAPVAGEGMEVSVGVHYLGAGDILAACPDRTGFSLEKLMSLPLLQPPPYLDALFRRRRTLFRRLEPWERRLRERRPWRGWGDHILLVLRRRTAEQTGVLT